MNTPLSAEARYFSQPHKDDSFQTPQPIKRTEPASVHLDWPLLLAAATLLAWTAHAA